MRENYLIWYYVYHYFYISLKKVIIIKEFWNNYRNYRIIDFQT